MTVTPLERLLAAHTAFARPGVADLLVDYPLGALRGAQLIHLTGRVPARSG